MSPLCFRFALSRFRKSRSSSSLDPYLVFLLLSSFLLHPSSHPPHLLYIVITMPPAKRRKVEHDWTWSASTLITGITLEHQRRAAGLVGLKSCKFIPFPPGDVAESSSVAATRMRPEAGCTEKGCKGNPLCYNHLGVEQVSQLSGPE